MCMAHNDYTVIFVTQIQFYTFILKILRKTARNYVVLLSNSKNVFLLP